MPALQLVILLSVGSFQATAPALPLPASAVFPDTAQGATAFVDWLRPQLPPPRFAQPPLEVCVVGAVPFGAERAPYLPKPLWESKPPWRQLEPYGASFHYVEPPAAGVAGKATKPRTLNQAVQICAAAQKVQKK